MATVDIHEAKAQLSRLLSRVEAGEEVVIAITASRRRAWWPLPSAAKGSSAL